MERSCIHLEKSLDKRRCTHPSVSAKPKFDHHLQNSGFAVLGPRGLCCSGVPRSESLSALRPSQHCLHPETRWSRAKCPGVGVAGGLLCGHLKHRASLSLKAVPFLCDRGDRSVFAGQMEVLLDQLYLLYMPAVPRLWLPHAAPLPPDGPHMGWQPAEKVAGGGT